jgi:YHS domain-containing protein
VAPSPPLKPEEPSPAKPVKGTWFSPRGNDPDAAEVTAIQSELSIQADWNASLEPDAMGGNHLRSASFEERTTETGNPFRCALEGYCPVQLRDGDRWVPGSANCTLSYQGHVFRFSSNAARERFEAAPDKYAPAHGGNDIVLTVEENRTVPGSVKHSAVYHGRLYLFANSATLATFQEDPARYARGPRQTALQIPASSL